MPETLGRRRAVHLQNAYLYMASGLDALAYFIYEWSTPQALEALGEVGPLMRRHRKLLGALKPAPHTVGLLVPFENCCFRSLYPADAMYAFFNLAMAHAEVEPVWPQELPERAAQYKAIVLHDVDWLTEGNLRILKDYIAGGGTVLCDSLTEVDVPGAVRLDFPLAGHDRRKDYGDPAQIARVRSAVERHVRPHVTSDDPHLFLRRFQAAGVDYVWVVNLMTHQQDLDHLPEPGKERDVETPPAYADLDKRPYAARIRVHAPAVAAYSVFAGERLASTSIGDWSVIPVRMGTWQGCLIALYPAAPTALRVEAPLEATQGQAVEVRVTALAGDEPLRACLPVEVSVVDPAGALSAEYTRDLLTADGTCSLRIPFARNDAPGAWRVTARELSSGLEKSAVLQLREK